MNTEEILIYEPPVNETIKVMLESPLVVACILVMIADFVFMVVNLIWGFLIPTVLLILAIVVLLFALRAQYDVAQLKIRIQMIDQAIAEKRGEITELIHGAT